MPLLVLVGILAIVAVTIAVLAARTRNDLDLTIRSFSDFLDALTPAVSSLSTDVDDAARRRRTFRARG